MCVSLTQISTYIVGPDGSHSLIRRTAEIAFNGDHTDLKWKRIDGRVKTKMPDADIGFASIESQSHGNVLWVQFDHGVKRIGFAMTDVIIAKYGGRPTEQKAKEETIHSTEPLTLVFTSVEWRTLYRQIQSSASNLAQELLMSVYSIHQRVTDHFFANELFPKLFIKLFNEAIHFNIGLGINYPENLITRLLPLG